MTSIGLSPPQPARSASANVAPIAVSRIVRDMFPPEKRLLVDAVGSITVIEDGIRGSGRLSSAPSGRAPENHGIRDRGPEDLPPGDK